MHSICNTPLGHGVLAIQGTARFDWLYWEGCSCGWCWFIVFGKRRTCTCSCMCLRFVSVCSYLFLWKKNPNLVALKPHHFVSPPSSVSWRGSAGRLCRSCVGPLRQSHSDGGLAGRAQLPVSEWGLHVVLQQAAGPHLAPGAPAELGGGCGSCWFSERPGLVLDSHHFCHSLWLLQPEVPRLGRAPGPGIACWCP